MSNIKLQTLGEYLLVVAVISLIVIGGARLFGGTMRDATTRTSCLLMGNIYIAGDEPGQAVCEKR